MESVKPQSSSIKQADSSEMRIDIIWNHDLLKLHHQATHQPLSSNGAFQPNAKLMPEGAEVSCSDQVNFQYERATGFIEGASTTNLSDEHLVTKVAKEPTVHSQNQIVPTTAVPAQSTETANVSQLMPMSTVPGFKTHEATADASNDQPKCYCNIIPSEKMEKLAKHYYFRHRQHLAHWFSSGTSKQKLLLEVERDWKELSSDQKKFYNYQVVEKLSKEVNHLDPRALTPSQRKQLEYLKGEGKPNVGFNMTVITPQTKPSSYCSTCSFPAPRVNPDLARMVTFKIPEPTLPIASSTEEVENPSAYLKAKRVLKKRPTQEKKPKEPKQPKTPKIPKAPKVPKVPKAPKVNKPTSKPPLTGNRKRAWTSDIVQQISPTVSKNSRSKPSLKTTFSRNPFSVPSLRDQPSCHIQFTSTSESELAGPECENSGNTQTQALQTPVMNFVFEWAQDGSMVLADKITLPPAAAAGKKSSYPPVEQPMEDSERRGSTQQAPEYIGKVQSAATQAPVANYVFKWSQDGTMILSDAIILPAAEEMHSDVLGGTNLEPVATQMPDVNSVVVGERSGDWKTQADGDMDVEDEELNKLIACSAPEENELFLWLLGAQNTC